MRLLAVKPGIDVSAAGQDEPYHAVEKRSVVGIDRCPDRHALGRDFVRVELEGAQHLGGTAGRQDGLYVVEWDACDLGVVAAFESGDGDPGAGEVAALVPVRCRVGVLFRGIQIAQFRQSFRFPRATVE
ncbi:MAG: hypothetical protein M3516_10285 [Actinomycetota bacterium]|nr:hypothetical protein [Actinomycetota bacterium]